MCIAFVMVLYTYIHHNLINNTLFENISLKTPIVYVRMCSVTHACVCVCVCLHNKSHLYSHSTYTHQYHYTSVPLYETLSDHGPASSQQH